MQEKRYSRQRELVFNILKDRCDHPTADMVYESALKTQPNISLGTVYRNLKLLADEGVISTLETNDKKLHYDGDTKEHIHFVCQKCGRIIDYFTKITPPTCINDDNNVVNNTKCFFYGLCKNCIE